SPAPRSSTCLPGASSAPVTASTRASPPTAAAPAASSWRRSTSVLSCSFICVPPWPADCRTDWQSVLHRFGARSVCISAAAGGSLLAQKGHERLHCGTALGRQPLEVHLPIRYLPEGALVHRHQFVLHPAERFLRYIGQVGSHSLRLGRSTTF